MLLVLMPTQTASSKLYLRFQHRLLAAADARLALAGEVISNIRIVKFFA